MKSVIINGKVVPAEVIVQVTDLVKQGYDLMAPYTVPLTPEDRKALPKIADGTEPFASQCLIYMGTNKDLVPAYLDVKSLSDSYDTYTNLGPLYYLLNDFTSQISDTRMVAGSTTYSGVLAFYDAVRTAAAKRIAGAKTIHDNLKKRFAKKKKKGDDTAKPGEEGQNPDAAV